MEYEYSLALGSAMAYVVRTGLLWRCQLSRSVSSCRAVRREFRTVWQSSRQYANKPRKGKLASCTPLCREQYVNDDTHCFVSNNNLPSSFGSSTLINILSSCLGYTRFYMFWFCSVIINFAREWDLQIRVSSIHYAELRTVLHLAKLHHFL